MAELEKDALAPKSWDMRGEVRGVDRPENSLLEVSVDVERYLQAVFLLCDLKNLAPFL